MKETYKNAKTNENRSAARHGTANMRNIYVACVFFAAAVLLVLCMFLFFNVTAIKIQGVTLYEDEQILVVGGVQNGQNLVRTNTDIVEKRLKDTLVYIDDVKVTKKFPSTLVINCTEAEKAADIEHDGSYYVLSSSGKILETKNPRVTGNIPVVEGFELKSKEQGEKISSEDSFKADILTELLADFEELKFENIDSIDMTTRSDIKLMYDGRIEIRLGSSVDMEYKLTYLKAVIDESLSDGYEGTLIYNGADSGISAIPKEYGDSSEEESESSSEPVPDSSAVQTDAEVSYNTGWAAGTDDTAGYGDTTTENYGDYNGETAGNEDQNYGDGYTDYNDNGYDQYGNGGYNAGNTDGYNADGYTDYNNNGW